MLAATIALTAGLALTVSPDETVKLQQVAKGATSKVGGYMPQRTVFGPDKPASVTKLPPNVSGPQYGTITIAGAPVLFIIDEPEGKPALLFVDANRNGDFTDDPAVEWKGKENTAKDKDGAEKKSTTYSGSCVIDIGEKDRPFPATIAMYRFDKNDNTRIQYRTTLLYYNDYGYEGTATIGEKQYRVMLNDATAKGDFRGAQPAEGAPASARSGVNILVDRNADGKFDSRAEQFDILKPFSIDGVTYEVKDVARDGSSFRIVKSDKSVAEIPLPPDHSVGKAITPFKASDTEGKAVNFPADYKGKVVLIDFWATWCGPCMKEMPNVVSTYDKFHAKGFEILGISLDSDKSIGNMPKVMTDAHMSWRQVADGKYWDAEIARLYAIRSIPATYLVDGNTGKIIGANLRGEALEKAVEKALSQVN